MKINRRQFVRNLGLGTASLSMGSLISTSSCAPSGAVSYTHLYSYIGYRSQEIKVGNQTHINVRLSEDVETLDEVVVVGYGVQNKRDVTGSIAKVGSEELMSVPTSSFDAALQGRAAGVQVTQTSGLAGSGAAIRVRGIASITAGGDPLIVVDGIPIMQNAGDRVGAAQDNPMSSINANDIESIDILKDASATAIYGSRGCLLYTSS